MKTNSFRYEKTVPIFLSMLVPHRNKCSSKVLLLISKFKLPIPIFCQWQGMIGSFTNSL